METSTNNLFTPITDQRPNYIKVIGVGGGGGNAVNYMFTQGIQGVDFVLCNTDSQALNKSGISTKVHLGQHDLGAGNNPDFGREAAESEVSLEELNSIIDADVTKMVFITAGMGGGTGTGAAPVVAKIAKEKGILTVGIVTLPFECEGRRRKQQAERGIKELGENVDALIVISNDNLRKEYGDMILTEAFHKADEVLLTAAKGIAEIITVPGYINVDFRDVDTVMRKSGKAIMGMGKASGERRAEEALDMALNSPLLNDNDINGAKNLLIRITSAPGANEIKLDEATTIIERAQDRCGNVSDVIWGNGYDETLGDSINITVIATGFGDTENTPKITTHELKTESITEKPVQTPCSQARTIHTISFEPTKPICAPIEEKKQEPEEQKPETIFNFNLTADDIDDSTAQAENSANTISEAPDQQPEPITDNAPIVHSLDMDICITPKPEIQKEEVKPDTETPQSPLIHMLEDPIDEIDDDIPMASDNQQIGDMPISTMQSENYRAEQQQPNVRRFDNMFGGNDSENDFEITSRLSSDTQLATIEKVEIETERIENIRTENKIDPRVEQRNKLRSLSQFNFSNDQELSMIENVPAYLRHNKSLDTNNGNEEELSRYTGTSEGTYSKNSYLHDNID